MKVSVAPVKNKYNLFAIELDRSEEKASVPDPTNHVWIFDRSGSMYYTLPQLVDDMVERSKQLRDGDTLSIGWFSTENGKFGWIFIGLSVNSSFQNTVKSALQKYKSVVGLTCFSEILADTYDNIIGNLSALPGTVSLMFMTDGYPVVSNYKQEVQKILNTMRALNDKVSSVMLVGYGDYYNKELMAQMTANIGGTLIHSSHLTEFDSSMEQFVGSEKALRVSVPLPVMQPLMVVGYDGFNVQQYPVEILNTMDAVTYVPENANTIYVLADINHMHDLTHYDTVSSMTYEQSYVAPVALAYAFVSSAKSDIAIEMLGSIGEVALIKEVNNAFTNEEYGNAQNSMLLSLDSEAFRFIEGQDTDFVPADDAFCLLDAIDLLMADSKAYFYPRHELFNYKRTGVPTKTRDGYPKFFADSTTACPFNHLTWNQKRLNLSILAKIPGHVNLPDAVHVGLREYFQCHQYRNYTLVKDSILNTPTLPVSMSYDTFHRLVDAGMLPDNYYDEHDEDTIYLVDLGAVPLVNKKIATAPTSTEYCGWLDHELELTFMQKFLNNKIKELDPTGIMEKVTSEFTNEQIEFLETYGIKHDRLYSPPVDKEESIDHYFAKEFEVKIKGYSSAPKIDDVLSKMADGKKLTPSNQLMSDVIKSFENNMPNSKDPLSTLEYAKASLNRVKNDLRNVRDKIQRTRFAVLLCKQWFPDLDTRDGAEVDLDDKHFTFAIRDVKVDY